MAGEDIIPSLGLDTSSFDAGLAAANAKAGKFSGDVAASIGRADGAVVKLGKSSKALAQPIKAAADSTAHLRAESEKLEKVASLLGPQVGGVVSMMSKLGKTAGSDIGGATLAIVGLTAGIGAGLYVMSSYAAMVADTVENVDDLAASLDVVTRERLAAQITSLQKSKVALGDAADGWTELKIVLSDLVDGPMADVATVASMVAEGWALVGENAKKAGVDVTNAIPYVGTLITDLERLAKLKGLVDQYYAKPTPGPMGSTNYSSDELAALLGMPTGNATTTVAPAKPMAQPATARNRAAPSGGVDAIESSMFLAGITIPKSQIDLHAAGLAAITDLDKQYAEQKAALDKQIADETIAQMERETTARQAAVQNAIAGASAVASSLIDLGTQATDAAVANTEEGTEAHRQALLAQLTMQETSAIAQAALGIVNIWSQWAAMPIVAGALTAIELAATGIAIGQIESQKAKLHTGGVMSGDEYVVRANEVPAMLTAEGAKNRQGLADLNAGTASKNVEPVIYLVNESGMQRARQHTKPRPDLGLRMVGAR